MAGKRYYKGDLDDTRVKPQEFGVGRQNDKQGTGTAVEVVTTYPIEGKRPGTLVSVPPERANWLVAEGYAAYRAEYESANPGWKPTDGGDQV